MPKHLLPALLLAAASAGAHATLMGDTVHIAQNFPQLGSEFFPTNAVVSFGNEFVWPEAYSIDVGANTIRVTFGAPFFVDVPDGGNNHNGPVISDLDDSSGLLLSGFSNFATNTAFSPSNIVFGADFIGFNFDNMNFVGGQFVDVTLNFTRPVQPQLPNPATPALLALGLLALGWARQHRPALAPERLK